MNKLFIPFISLGLAACVASCNSDEPSPMPEQGGQNPDGTEKVAIKVKVGSGSRSRGADAQGWCGDGKDIAHVRYCVYDATESTPLFTHLDQGEAVESAAEGGSRVFKLDLSLPKGGSFVIAVWADHYGDNAANPYSVDFNTNSVTVDYQKSYSAFDKADAFFGKLAFDTETIKDQTVTLTRPVAQINFLSKEFANPAVGDLYPNGVFAAVDLRNSLDVSGGVNMPNKWNWRDNSYDYVVKEQSYLSSIAVSAKGNLPDVNFQGGTYKPLFMGYVLAPASDKDMPESWKVGSLRWTFFKEANGAKSTLDGSLDYSAQSFHANDRVVIYSESDGGNGSEGGLLTGINSFKVIIDSNFSGVPSYAI